MTPDEQGTGASAGSKTTKKQTDDADPALSRDATFSTYAENADTGLADLAPPTGQHVEQELGVPVEATEGTQTKSKS